LYEIRHWNFWKDLATVAPRQALARQIVCRLRQYLGIKDNRCASYKRNLTKWGFPAPLLDEQIWTFLVAYGYRSAPAKLFEELTGKAYTRPAECSSWLEMMPMPPRRGGNGKGSEGNSNIDLIVGSIEMRDGTTSGVQYHPGGPVCLVEAKWKSDIAVYTSHDPHRNQLARVIETAVTLQYHHVSPKNQYKPAKPNPMPDDVYVTLLTPARFKASKYPWSRLYAYKFHEYDKNRGALIKDIERQDVFGVEKRMTKDWKYPEKSIRSRLQKVHLCWVTYEDLLSAMPDNKFRAAMAKFVKMQPDSCLLDRRIFPGRNACHRTRNHR